MLTVGYDCENLTRGNGSYQGEITVDYYGRLIPKHAHGTVNLAKYSSSTKEMVAALDALFTKIVDPSLLIKRINITANGVVFEYECKDEKKCEQLDFFTDFEEAEKAENRRRHEYAREKNEQRAIISIRKRFGKNAILKGMNFEDGATTIERNMQIGGHRA